MKAIALYGVNPQDLKGMGFDTVDRKEKAAKDEDLLHLGFAIDKHPRLINRKRGKK